MWQSCKLQKLRHRKNQNKAITFFDLLNRFTNILIFISLSTLALLVVDFLSPSARAEDSTLGTDSTRVVKPSFIFYSIIHSNQDVDKSNYGFDKEFPIIYPAALWPTNADRDEPDPEYISTTLQKRFSGTRLRRLIINIEHWPVGTNLQYQIRSESMNKYIAVLEAARQALPETEIGLYSVLPVREYWIPVIGAADKLAEWEAANRQLKILADYVDFIAPSLYTFYNSRSFWIKYAVSNINAARIYGKPVYPFLWPRYHSSNNFYPEQLIERDFFDTQLRLVYELADSVIVWNGPYDRWELPAHWFEQTKRTIEHLRSK